jgi:hypothetical protein
MVKTETVQVMGKWIASVSWGDGMTAINVRLTTEEAKAARFSPPVAAALRVTFGPEEMARREASRQAAEAAAARLFEEAMDSVSHDMGIDARAILKDVL